MFLHADAMELFISLASKNGTWLEENKARIPKMRDHSNIVKFVKSLTLDQYLMNWSVRMTFGLLEILSEMHTMQQTGLRCTSNH